jgi:Secretion system C-terminal sorting domain
LDNRGATVAPQQVINNPLAFKVNVYPNPSSSQFTIHITGDSKAPVYIRITDMSGRVQLIQTVNGNTLVTLGSQLTAGAYIAEVTQGNSRELIKLIKVK